METQYIRNFAIIAHVDHGKSTLADRFIEMSQAVNKREFRAQMLDSMDIERERGITIKAQTVRLKYISKAGVEYQFNLIDTPGHVDFAYEVSRSLAACESSILVVDASQGVEAQTLANVYQAMDNNHSIITVLNKIDLPAAAPEVVRQNIEDVIGIDASQAICVSAKTGFGVADIFEAIIALPAPQGDVDAPLQALLIDSWYDIYLGVIVLVRIKDGSIRSGMEIEMMSNGAKYSVEKVGVFLPQKQEIEALMPGEIGFIVANIRHIEDCAVGDTITNTKHRATSLLPGFKASVSVVFCSIYPCEAADFNKLRDSLGKLRLNDSSFSYEAETSAALGMGFRCGFLGLLHLEIIHERLEKEFDLDLVSTAPSVSYQVNRTDGVIMTVHNPAEMPEVVKIESVTEPWVKATVITPSEYVGAIMQLCLTRRGVQENMAYSNSRVIMTYNMPLSEIVFDFYDKLKSISSGYASFDCEPIEGRLADVVKVSILVNGEPVDALACMVERSNSERIGRVMCEKLKEVIKRQQFKIVVQAAIGGKIIARETINAFRKDVIGEKCTGKDRKMKRKQAQVAGKKRMSSVGAVEIPKSAYLAVLKR
jgi:GTP-binding protein LepA